MRRAVAEPVTDAVLLTPQDVAGRMQVSVRTVVRLIKGGVIPARAVRGRMRLHWPEVVASLPPVLAAASVAAEPGVVALDVTKRLKLKSQYFYRDQLRSRPVPTRQ